MMTGFERIGSWLLDSKSGMVFGCLLMLGTATILGYEYLTRAESVTLSARDFVCVASEPHGLGTRCISYARSH